MILKLTQKENNLPCLIGISETVVMLQKPDKTFIGDFKDAYFTNVKETITEIEQQIKEGGICGTMS